MLAPQSAPEHVAASMTPNVATGAIAASIPGPGPNTQPEDPGLEQEAQRRRSAGRPGLADAEDQEPLGEKGADERQDESAGVRHHRGSLRLRARCVVPAADDPEAMRRASS